ncbi:MAG: fatty acid--CoA ligase family protein [Acidobacteriota bacterium]
MSETTERFWNTLGFAVIQGYGLTETTSLISVNHPFKVGRGTVGRILPGREVRLSEKGEILVRGSSIAKSYAYNKTTIPVSDSEGWFSTGDLGMLDEKGNLHFKGRKKHVIVSSEGMNIYPEDLQKTLMAQPEIRDCIVVGVQRNGKQEPCAVLLLESNGRPAKKVIQSANESLAEYQHVRYWCVWPDEDFPRTSTQKPRIGEIRDFAAS